MLTVISVLILQIKFIRLFVAATNGFDSGAFRRRLTGNALWETGYYGDSTVRSVTAALIFQYTPWPETENRSLNRDQLIEVRILSSIYIYIYIYIFCHNF